MKKIITISVFTYIFFLVGCNCNSNDGFIISKAEVKRPIINNAATLPIPQRIKNELKVMLNNSKGVLFDYSIIQNTIENELSNHTIYYRDADKNIQSKVYDTPSKFKTFSGFAMIPLDLLDNNETQNDDYIDLLVEELRTNYPNSYQNYLDAQGNVDYDKIKTEFKNKFTIVHHIVYDGEFIETNKYWLNNENDKIQTIYDVGAVCPPICDLF